MTTASTTTAKKPAPKKKAPAPSKKTTATKKRGTTSPAPKKKVLSPEEQEAVEAKKKADAALKEAEKLAQAAKKKKEAEAAKAKKEAEEKKIREATEKELTKDAKEINVRLEKAEKLIGQADDHRLAAAIKMDEAKERCRESKINFKEWSADNVKKSDGTPYSYESIRKLLPVGAAEREEEGAGAVMLEDMRNKNKKANQKARESAKTSGSATGSEPKSSPKRQMPEERALAAFDEMQQGSKENLVRSQAESMGYVLMDRDEAKRKTNQAKSASPDFADIADLKKAFKELSGSDQMTFANWAAEEVDLFAD